MEKDRLTISAIFIATYTTLIFSVPELLTTLKSLTLIQIVSAVCVSWGLLIDVIFFLFVSFCALEISLIKKIPYLDIELTAEEIKNVKNKLFKSGIYLVFFSIFGTLGSIPVLYKLNNNVSWGYFILFGIVYVGFFALILGRLFKRLKKR